MSRSSEAVAGHRNLRRYVLADERVVLATRHHWGKLLEPVVTTAAGFLVVAWLVSAAETAVGETALWLWWVWVVLALRLGWKILEWRNEWFVATDKRMLLLYGLVTHKVAMMPLTKVTDMSYSRSPVGQVLGYGQFLLESAGQDQALRQIDWVARPDVTYRQLCATIFLPGQVKAGGTPAPGPTSGTGAGPGAGPGGPWGAGSPVGFAAPFPGPVAGGPGGPWAPTSAGTPGVWHTGPAVPRGRGVAGEQDARRTQELWVGAGAAVPPPPPPPPPTTTRPPAAPAAAAAAPRPGRPAGPAVDVEPGERAQPGEPGRSGGPGERAEAAEPAELSWEVSDSPGTFVPVQRAWRRPRPGDDGPTAP